MDGMNYGAIAAMNEDTNKSVNPAGNANGWDAYQPASQSFGQKWAKKAHWFLTDIGVNYFINVTISVGLTYAFEKTLGAKYNNWLDNTLKGIENPTLKSVAKFLTKFATKSQILLMGGHTLIPFMKDFHDNKHSQTTSISNKLDGIAETFGFGDDASKQNRADYARLEQLMKDKPKEVGENDARILSKYGVDGSFNFIEEKKTWGDVLKSRLRAMMYSLVTNATLGAIEGQTGKGRADEKGLYTRGWADPISSGMGSWWPGLGKIFGKIPGFKKAFPDTELFGREYANDLILTAASTIGFSQGISASDKKGPDHDELLAQNRNYWAERIGKNSNEEARKTIDAGGFKPAEVKEMQAMLQERKTAGEQILQKDRPADMSARVQSEREVSEQELANSSR